MVSASASWVELLFGLYHITHSATLRRNTMFAQDLPVLSGGFLPHRTPDETPLTRGIAAVLGDRPLYRAGSDGLTMIGAESFSACVLDARGVCPFDTQFALRDASLGGVVPIVHRSVIGRATVFTDDAEDHAATNVMRRDAELYTRKDRTIACMTSARGELMPCSYRCPRCGNQTIEAVVSKQLRAADEGTTNFFRCKHPGCGFRGTDSDFM
jgi:DNA-directed RNA polymerase subunit M/transcription elongation factor TFIIS